MLLTSVIFLKCELFHISLCLFILKMDTMTSSTGTCSGSTDRITVRAVKMESCETFAQQVLPQCQADVLKSSKPSCRFYKPVYSDGQALIDKTHVHIGKGGSYWILKKVPMFRFCKLSFTKTLNVEAPDFYF